MKIQNFIFVFKLCLCVSVVNLFFVPTIWAETHFIDLSKAANRGFEESFDSTAGVEDLQQKQGLTSLPLGAQTFRGIPFQILDPSKNQGRSFVVLKGRRKPDFPEGVSISAHVKAPYLYFLHTCRWGGTAQNVTVAEYDIVYDDGQVSVIPLRVGNEFTNFFGADDTPSSFLAWWHKYKNTEMGVNLFPWKNPRPDKAIQSILFKSRGNMPVPILFAITTSDKELPVSPDSPKPEKTFQTDTSKWMPFEPGSGSSQGTAIDMSFLLDAPSGKHGPITANGDKLVFEDGTPARFWGIKLNLDNQSLPEVDLAVLAKILPIYGYNIISFDPVAAGVTESLKTIVEDFKASGIYLELNCGGKTVNSNGLCDDPAVVPQEIWSVGKSIRNASSANKNTPFDFDNRPMVLYPEQSFPRLLTFQRTLGTPFRTEWFNGWPSEYLGEMPLLMAAYSSFTDWTACLEIACNKGKITNWNWGSETKSEKETDSAEELSITNQLPMYIQSPVAALAYLRGDIKEGRIFVLDKDSSPLKVLAHKSGLQPENGKFKTDAGGQLKAKVNEKTKSFVSDTGQIAWQGNVGVVQISAPRFQALIGFLSHRKFNNAYWAVETPNTFASLSVISLTKANIGLSDHLLVTGVTRMENTGQVYNAAKTKLISPGKAPILVEPLSAKFVLYRPKADPKLRIRALDANGQPLKTRVSAKWVKNSYVFSWVPTAFYLEILK